MSLPERMTYSIAEAAEKLGMSYAEIQERLRARQIFCSVQLSGRFIEQKYNEDLSIGGGRPVSIGRGEGDYNNFVICNYAVTAPLEPLDVFELNDSAVLWRISEKGGSCIYAALGAHKLKIDNLFITAAEIDKFHERNSEDALNRKINALIEKRRQEKTTEQQIAIELHGKYGLDNHEIAKVMGYAEDLNKNQSQACKQRGQRLRNGTLKGSSKAKYS